MNFKMLLLMIMHIFPAEIFQLSEEKIEKPQNLIMLSNEHLYLEKPACSRAKATNGEAAVYLPHSYNGLNLTCKSSESFRVKATGGEAVLLYCEPPATKDLELSDDLHLLQTSGNAGSGVLRLFQIVHDPSILNEDNTLCIVHYHAVVGGENKCDAPVGIHVAHQTQ